MEKYHKLWEERLDRLDEYLKELQKQKKEPKHGRDRK